MEKNTLNGFEAFVGGLLPENLVDNKDINIDDATEELTDEELAALQGKEQKPEDKEDKEDKKVEDKVDKKDKENDDTKDDDIDTDDIDDTSTN